MDYIQQLFSTTDSNGVEDVVGFTGRCFTEEMNLALIADFSKIEVEATLKQMAPQKASGLDGMPPFFSITTGQALEMMLSRQSYLV